MRKYLIATLTFLLPLILQGQTVSPKEELLVIDVQNILDAGDFSFDNPKGSVTVTGYSGEMILVTGTPRHPTTDLSENDDMKRLDQYPFNMTAEIRGSQVLLLCDSRGRTVDFDIKIPEQFSLNIKSQDNGEIKIIQVNGDINAENPHGNITLLGIAGSVSLSSVEGNIIADFKKVDLSKPIMISTLDGDLELRIPEKSKMSFKMKSSQKEIKSNLNIVRGNRTPLIRMKKDKKIYTMDDWTYGTLNGGGPECTLSTYNGSITIKKRQ